MNTDMFNDQSIVARIELTPEKQFQIQLAKHTADELRSVQSDIKKQFKELTTPELQMCDVIITQHINAILSSVLLT